MVKINPIVGVYMPIIRIPIKGGMTIPKKTRLLTMAHMRFYTPLEVEQRVSECENPWKVTGKAPRGKDGIVAFPTITGWWQLKCFWNFHPEPWGNDPIWRAYFSKGLKPPTRSFFKSYVKLRGCIHLSHQKLPSLKLAVRTWTWMVGRWSFPFGAWNGLFSGIDLLLVLGMWVDFLASERG